MPAPWNGHAVARIIGELHGQETNNVLHFATNTALGGGVDLTELIALGVAIMECIETTLLPAVTQDWTVTAVTTQWLGTVLPTMHTDPQVTGPTGSGVGQLGATSVSFAASLVHLRSGIGGRNGRGRMFLPPPGEANIAASTIDNGTVDLIIAFLTCFIGKFVGASATTNFRLGVFSRKLGGANFSNFNNAFFEVTQLDASNKLAVIGRRRTGHGR